jgi:hypothetical protein
VPLQGNAGWVTGAASTARLRGGKGRVIGRLSLENALITR